MMTEKGGSAPCRHQPAHAEEEHGAHQHWEEGDTSVWQNKIKDEKYNFLNYSKRLHTQKNDWWRKRKQYQSSKHRENTKTQSHKTLHMGIPTLVYLDRLTLFNVENIDQTAN